MKKTKREFYNEIMAVEGISEEIVDFCKAEIALLDKKNANRKPSKEQQANEVFKAEIIEVLKASDSALTASEIRKSSVMLTEAGEVQKVSALLKQLVDNGEVVKTSDGKKSVFSTPVVEDKVAETD